MVESISKEKSLYIDTFDKKDPILDKKDLADIDKAAEMSGRIKNTKMSNIRHIFPKKKHITSS